MTVMSGSSASADSVKLSIRVSLLSILAIAFVLGVLPLRAAERPGLPDGCTVIGVGRLASADGSVITSHTDCCSECRIQVIPGRTYPKGAMAPVHWGMVYFGADDDRQALPLGDFGKVIGQIPQVEKTFTYFHTGYSQMNERQLAIGESTCSQRAELDVALRRGRHPPDHDHRAGPGLRPGAMRDGARGRPAHRRPRRKIRLPALVRRVRGALHRRSARALGHGDLQRRPGMDAGERQARRHLGGPPRPGRPCRRHRQLFPDPRDRPQGPGRAGLAELHEGGRRPRLVRPEERPAVHLAGGLCAADPGRQSQPDVAHLQHDRAVASKPGRSGR